MNVSVGGVAGPALVAAMQPVALATGSACNSRGAEPSFVLRALGRDGRGQTARGRRRPGPGRALNRPDKVASLLEAPRHHGKPAPGAIAAAAGSVRRGCAVQFSALVGASGLTEVRYLAFGGPELIAACEYVARGAEGRPTEPAPGGAAWLEALGLPRGALSTLLVVEDAWRGLLASARD